MDIGEAVAVFNSKTENKEENYCEGVKHEPAQSGTNLIMNLTGTATPENLLKNMKKHNQRDGEPHIPTLPTTIHGDWDLERCDRNTYPWQTHHLIPKKLLPTHAVCTWLTEKYKKHPKYELAADTCYSSDHANNGYCLPFASSTHQWKANAGKKNAQDEVAFEMMAKTGRQLHQGNHNNQDFDEEDRDKHAKYLDAARILLDRIFRAADAHVRACEHCKKEQGGKKIKVQPLHKIVGQVDMASLIMKLKIDGNQVFVSQRAYNYYAKYVKNTNNT